MCNLKVMPNVKHGFIFNLIFFFRAYDKSRDKG